MDLHKTLEIVKQFIKDHSKADLDKPDIFGWTALYRAAYRQNETMVAVLVDTGVDLDMATDDGHTALSVAAHRGNETIVKKLLQHNAAVYIKNNKYNQTACDIAVQKNNLEIAQLLHRYMQQEKTVDAQ